MLLETYKIQDRVEKVAETESDNFFVNYRAQDRAVSCQLF